MSEMTVLPPQLVIAIVVAEIAVLAHLLVGFP